MLPISSVTVFLVNWLPWWKDGSHSRILPLKDGPGKKYLNQTKVYSKTLCAIIVNDCEWHWESFFAGLFKWMLS